MALNHVTLEDKYDLGKSRIFVTGFQALVRLCMMQKERDRRAGLNTAGYVTGYRGSPLGTLDLQFIRAQRQLDRYDIRFQCGTNEDIAATALWGSQQAELRGEGRFDGVFGLWYGKGPGVDRTGGVFAHRAPVRVPLHRRDDPDPEPGGGAGDPRLRTLRLGDVALLRRLGGAQVDARDGGIDRRDRRQPRARQHRHSQGLRDPGGGPKHPPA